MVVNLADTNSRGTPSPSPLRLTHPECYSDTAQEDLKTFNRLSAGVAASRRGSAFVKILGTLAFGIAVDILLWPVTKQIWSELIHKVLLDRQRQRSGVQDCPVRSRLRNGFGLNCRHRFFGGCGLRANRR